jgi:citrate lyase gamma subunit
MFAEPTINDFLDNVRWHLAKAGDNARRAVDSVIARLAAAGVLQSGRAIIEIFDAVRTEFDAGIETAFGELKRTINRTSLNRTDLRQAAVSCLENFAIEMKSLTQADQYRRLAAQAVDERLNAMDRHLAFAIRRFDTGFLDPIEPERPNVNNSINIGTMTGSAIQHGSPGATQSVQFNLKIDEAKSALAAFESAMKTVQLPKAQLDEVTADLQTIAAQLSKASPSLAIIQEAGRSLRNIVESVAAGIMTPSVLALAPALWSALGLG